MQQTCQKPWWLTEDLPLFLVPQPALLAMDEDARVVLEESSGEGIS